MPSNPDDVPHLEADVGPFYEHDRLLELWRNEYGPSSTPNLAGLIPLPASDGRTVYPAHHFIHPSKPWPAGPLPSLGQLQKTLASSGASPLTIAKWLAYADQRFSGLTALQWLRMGRRSAVVIDAASHDASRWKA